MKKSKARKARKWFSNWLMLLVLVGRSCVRLLRTKLWRGIGKPAAKSASVRQEREHGPPGWLMPIRESAYSRLVPTGTADVESTAPPAQATGGPAVAAFRSVFRPGRGEGVLLNAPITLWSERLAQYKQRKVARAAASTQPAMMAPGAPAILGARNWMPLGPAVVQNGQAQGQPPVGGRVVGIAIAPGGNLLYAASACGGVFRSDDAGMSWRALMDSFDVDPTSFAATSLACGAIAIDPSDPNRVYVGTGEGDTNAIFASRIVNALPAYRGIGPIRSDDGGKTWVVEPTATTPGLAGQAFFALAVDPLHRESVVGATSAGLWQRAPAVGGGFAWVLRRPGVHSSVVVTQLNGAPLFLAAEWGSGVFTSPDGANWSPLGTGFPSANVGRIAIGLPSSTGDAVYAFVANTLGAVLGLYRCSATGGTWEPVTGLPDVLPVDENGGSQGSYDLAIAVDPNDSKVVYLGGSYYKDHAYWPASIWRCRIAAQGGALQVSPASIGVCAHADVHVLVHSPGDSNALWVGCDGGVFLNRDPGASGNFAARNNGLACLCLTFFAQDPTDPGILFCGLQDNGTARTSGGPIWNHVNGGDGGYCLINWADPQQVIAFANGWVYRSTTGGTTEASWKAYKFPWSTMTEPIVGPPYDPANPINAKLVALGSGRSVYVSKDFFATWPPSQKIDLPATGSAYSLAFASASRFYVGTTAGEVFRADKSDAGWTVRRIDNLAAGPLGLRGLVSDIAIDGSDANGASIYVAFGGVGDYRHVWQFDGTRWAARSGPAGTNEPALLDVEHNALVVDPAAPTNVYVGADIGVWHSADSGNTWHPLANGLPDAAVFDLQIHPTRHLLRAATHGRGLYELDLS